MGVLHPYRGKQPSLGWRRENVELGRVPARSFRTPVLCLGSTAAGGAQFFVSLKPKEA